MNSEIRVNHSSGNVLIFSGGSLTFFLVGGREEPLQSIFASSTFHTQESAKSTGKSRFLYFSKWFSFPYGANYIRKAFFFWFDKGVTLKGSYYLGEGGV